MTQFEKVDLDDPTVPAWVRPGVEPTGSVLRKRTAVFAHKATEDGVIVTERGPMAYKAGDWLLTTMDEPMQSWPITQEYLDANYEVVGTHVPR